MRKSRSHLSRCIRGMKWSSIIFYPMVMALLVILFFFYQPYMDSLHNQRREFPLSASFDLDRDLSITSHSVPIDYTVRTYYPPEVPDEGMPGVGEIQHIERFICNPTPVSPIGPGQRAIWQGSLPGGTKVISVSYSIRLTTVSWDIDSSISGTIANINASEYTRQYLGDQWPEDVDGDGEPDDRDHDGIPDSYKISPGHSQISTLAKAIAGNDTNVYDVVLKVYKYMSDDDEFTYDMGRDGTPVGAVETLRTRKGDCDDQSILFISLLRSLNIPSWITLGLLYDPVSGEWFGHAWSNVLIPLKSGDFEIVTIDVVNDQFLLRSCYHLTEWVDDGVRASHNDGKWSRSSLEEYYYYFEYKYSSPRRPRVWVREIFTVNSMKTSGSVWYDPVKHEVFQPESIPIHIGPFQLILVTLATALVFRKSYANKH